MPPTGPSFFVVGNPKCGTTTLDELLGAHPDLFLCRPKDSHHFAEDLNQAHHGPFRPSTWEEHLARFDAARPSQQLGEASACYTLSDVAIERIAAQVPEARIIVSFREPVAMVRSWHLQLLRDPGLERVADLGQALELEPSRRRGEQLPPGCALPRLLRYSDLVRGADQLDRIYASFPAEQVHVVLHDDLAQRPEQTLAGLFAFLGVDPSPVVEPAHANPGVQATSNRLEDLRNRVIANRPGDTLPVRLVAGALYRTLSEERLHQVNDALKRRLHRAPPAMDPELEGRLRTRWAPEVVRLGEALDVDLVERWGYEQVA